MQKGAVLLCCKLTPQGAVPVPPGERCDLYSLDRRASVLCWCWMGTEGMGHLGQRAVGTALPWGQHSCGTAIPAPVLLPLPSSKLPDS